MKCFITFGNDKYNGAKKRIYKEAVQFSFFDNINIYEPEHIDSNFKKKYNDILFQTRGSGYWLWKSYFISKKLSEINFGDYLIYCDAGCTINKKGIPRLYEYIDMIEKSELGIISFQMGFSEKKYTTSQVFDKLNINYDSDILTSGQYVGGILIMKKCDNVLNIFNKFFEVIDSDHNLITDHYNKINQIPEFKDNRHDQSILSVIRKLYGSIVLSDETWFKNFNSEEALKIPFLATRKN